MLNTPTRTPLQAPPKLVIGGNLLALWLQGAVSIKPTAEAWRTPSEPREHKPHTNGNALPDDDAVARFVVLAGVERVRRVLGEFEPGGVVL